MDWFNILCICKSMLVEMDLAWQNINISPLHVPQGYWRRNFKIWILVRNLILSFSFFVVEDHILNTTQGLVERAYIDDLWDMALGRVVAVLRTHIVSCLGPFFLFPLDPSFSNRYTKNCCCCCRVSAQTRHWCFRSKLSSCSSLIHSRYVCRIQSFIKTGVPYRKLVA